MRSSLAHGFFAAVASSLIVAGAYAQRSQPSSTPKGGATAALAVPLGQATLQKLKSGDPMQIKAGLDEARLSGKAAAPAVPVLSDLLQKGLPYPLTESALDVLGDIEAEQASGVITWYARHRSASVRRAAVRALVHTKGALASKTLRGALADSDAMVRGIAATGLGTLKAKESVPDLFIALDHRVNEAAVSIGQLCTPAECDQLEGRLGKLPFDVVTSGLDQILFRPPGEVSDDAKVKLVGRLRELGTGEANRFLRDVQKRWPATWSQRIKQSIDQGVMATAGGPGAVGGGEP
jgi:hypothetical protein